MDCPTCGKTLASERGMRQHHTKIHDQPLPNRSCRGCGTEFYDPKSRLEYCENCEPNAGTNNGNWSGATESTDCVRCETTFEYYPSNKAGVYCSECVEGAAGLLPTDPDESGEKVTVPCEHCEADLERYPSAVQTSSYGSFCDESCYGAWLSENVVGENHHQWEGGAIDYGNGWWRVRRRALRRDRYLCRNCGRTASDIGRKPDVHHLQPVRAFDDPSDAHTLDNVVSLCRRCHRLAESGGIEPPFGPVEK